MKNQYFFAAFVPLAFAIISGVIFKFQSRIFLTSLHQYRDMSLPSKLPATIFNRNLSRNVLTVWFTGLPPDATAPTKEAIARWFGTGSPDAKAEVDRQCWGAAKEALDCLSPTKYPLPPFTSFDADRSNAAQLAAPFRKAIVDQSQKGEGQALESTDVARSFVLLFDQFSRNIFRDEAGQAMVYSHYDRLARALVYCLLGLNADAHDVLNLDKQGSHSHSVAHRVWFMMPMMHSEYIGDHDVFSSELDKLRNMASERKDDAALSYLETATSFEQSHREIIEKFNRYPHRNQPLGRAPIDEEKGWLEGGGARFGT